MLKNYFKIAWRNLIKNKGYSLINILGLAVGMAVSILIGLWVYDELSFDKYHKNYSRIARVKQSQTFNGVVITDDAMPYPLGDALRAKYGSEFKSVVMSSWTYRHSVAFGNKAISVSGAYMEPDAPTMLGLDMVKGSYTALADPSSILISQSVAEAIFKDSDPLGKTLILDKKASAKIAGIYRDLPGNSTFNDLGFIGPWDLYVSSETWIKDTQQDWSANSFQTFVQLADHADLDQVSAKIGNIKLDAVGTDEKKFKAEMFLQPMSKWHLYSEFKNGENTGGQIRLVWLFGIIGIFVLLLACINFMNLSTARSEKRAKEVGIRKTMGSLRPQLVVQFFSESLLVVILGFGLSLLLVALSLPAFNEISGKMLSIRWDSVTFWLINAVFILFTALVAGSYPALYLSSFKPVKVLKGKFRAGRLASIPRKALVILQFSVSIILIIGTIIVFRQIQLAKDLTVGYDRAGLITVELNTDDIGEHFDSFHEELMRTGAATGVAQSQGSVAVVTNTNTGFSWKGKDPEVTTRFITNAVSIGFGKTVGWKFTDGRDFSEKMATDSQAIVVNDSAIKFMGLKNPVGKTVTWGDQPFKVIGIVKNMVTESPYMASRPAIFYLGKGNFSNFATIKLKPETDIKASLSKVETVFKHYSPSAAFNYKFADQDYAAKFANESRIGKLATLFAGLAIFISCMGLFGMASFTAEQRTKEIGIRKVLGASIADVWKMLSREFVILVLISCLIGIPIAAYFLDQWLQSYDHRTDISWWIYAVTITGALLITIATVSFQAIKVAISNPVKSLRAE